MLSVQSSYLHSNYNHYHVRSSQRQGTRKTVLDCGTRYKRLLSCVSYVLHTLYKKKNHYDANYKVNRPFQNNSSHKKNISTYFSPKLKYLGT